MRIFLTGGTGFLGGYLVPQLIERNDSVVVLTRNGEKAKDKLSAEIEVVEGDPLNGTDWHSAVDGCDAVINLAGEHVFAKRWNQVQKTELRNSRILTTMNLVQAITSAKNRPKTLVSTSGVGYYGADCGNRVLTEDSPHGSDFLAQLCKDWEATAMEAEPLSVRVSIIRVGVVLAEDGGALQQMLTPFKLGVGGPVGAGKQWVSWIHVDDLVNVYLKALDDEKVSGSINGVAPEPVTNKTLSQEFAETLHRPCLLPIPPVALRMLFGEVAYVVTGSQKVLPEKLQNLGFNFKYPTCREAMQSLFNEAVV